MNAEQRFLSEGAEYFGNRLIYKNRDVGYTSPSGLSLNEHGEEVLLALNNITDVVAKEVKPRKAKVPAVEPAPEVPSDPDLDSLLGAE